MSQILVGALCAFAAGGLLAVPVCFAVDTHPDPFIGTLIAVPVLFGFVTVAMLFAPK